MILVFDDDSFHEEVFKREAWRNVEGDGVGMGCDYGLTGVSNGVNGGCFNGVRWPYEKTLGGGDTRRIDRFGGESECRLWL
jgi:hypothetical protein